MASHQKWIGEMKWWNISFVVVFLALAVPCLAGEEISVTLSLDRNEATLADSVRLVVSVSGTRKSESYPVIEGLDSFGVNQGGSSSRVEIINGKYSAGVDYTFFVKPRKPGTFEIGPAEVRFKGKIFRSNTVTLKILKDIPQKGAEKGPLFLTASISSSEAYVEEQLFYTLKLHIQNQVSDISLELPDNEHLSFRQLGKPSEYEETYNGKPYRVLVVRYALLPSEPGGYVIAPSKMKMTVYKPGRGRPRGLDPFFSDPFFSAGTPTTLGSEPLELKVIPLPEEGRPADFSGLVGSFKIESSLKPSEIKAGESATLTVYLSGRGNVNRIPDLKGPEVANAKVYADQPVLKISADSKGMIGSKIMKWAIVPEKEGICQIPPASMSFFDNESRRYRVIRTSPHSLKVLPGKEEQIMVQAGKEGQEALKSTDKQEVKQLALDILPVHTSIEGLKSGLGARPNGLMFWAILFAPAVAYITTLLAVKYSRKSSESIALTKSRKAAKVLIQECRSKETSASELAFAIKNYLNDRFGLCLGSLTPDEAGEILRSKGVNHGTAQKLHAVIKGLEDAIYTGRGQKPYETGHHLPKVLKEIEREIR
jgi:hypothetical protein